MPPPRNKQRKSHLTMKNNANTSQKTHSTWDRGWRIYK